MIITEFLTNHNHDGKAIFNRYPEQRRLESSSIEQVGELMNFGVPMKKLQVLFVNYNYVKLKLQLHISCGIFMNKMKY